MNLINLLLPFILLFSFSAQANWVKESSLKGPHTTYIKSKVQCELAEGEDCFDITDKDMRKFMVGQIDDLTRQKYSKEDLSVCDGPSECQTLLAGKDCSPHGEGAFGTINIDYTEAYCAKPDGFFQKPGLVADGPGTAQAAQDDAAKDTEATTRSTKAISRMSALQTCATTLRSAPTNDELIVCVLEVVRQLVGNRLDISEL